MSTYETYEVKLARLIREGVEETIQEYRTFAEAVKARSLTPLEEARLIAGFCYRWLDEHEEEYGGTQSREAMQSVLFEAFPWLAGAVEASEALPD